jgi:hypothetical protein
VKVMELEIKKKDSLIAQLTNIVNGNKIEFQNIRNKFDAIEAHIGLPKVIPSAFMDGTTSTVKDVVKENNLQSFANVALAGASSSNPIAAVRRNFTKFDRPFNNDELARVLEGKSPSVGRVLETVYLEGIKANKISLVKNVLKHHSAVDLKHVVNIDFIGRDICEIVLEKSYVETFIATVETSLPNIEFLVLDPLNPAFVKHHSDTASNVVIAARGYMRRLENRLKRPISTGHRRFVESEISRAKAQMESGIFVSKKLVNKASSIKENTSNVDDSESDASMFE